MNFEKYTTCILPQSIHKPCHKKVSLFKMLTLPKVIYRFNVISIKTSTVFAYIEKSILKFIERDPEWAKQS